MKKLKLIFIIIIINSYAFSQNDSINSNSQKYAVGFKFKEGIYVSYIQFKTNSPVAKSKIVTDIDVNRIDFFETLFQKKTIKYFSNTGELIEIESDKIWGFSNRSVIYINYNDEFNRIPVIGNISHFVSNFTYIETQPYSYNSYNNYYANSNNYRTELRQYVIDFESGKIMDFSSKSIEALIVTDNNLYDEFVSLSARKKDKQKFIFLRRFNETNPIYFPK
jgi:hypothetical protein